MLIVIINNLFELYYYLILASVIASWLPESIREHSLMHLVYSLVEPYLGVFRKLLSPLNLPIDLSPIPAIFALRYIKGALFQLLFWLGVL